jgi:DNA-binding LacI/PurR family transcriptional regulator
MVMAVRLQDVAAHAGVSVKTVSNVVNGYVHVAPGTRARVEAAIIELGYRPNLSARNLRGGRSGIIALAVPEIGVPYFAELAQEIVAAASSRGFTVLIDQTEGRADQEQQVLEGIRAHLIDGLIFSPLATGQRELSQREDTTPLVLLGERGTGCVSDHVAIDNVAASREAVMHLAQQGRRRVAAIGAQHADMMVTAHLRLAGYQEGLKQAGLAFDPTLVAEAPSFHRLEGARAMTRLLDEPQPPDAVFAFSDLLALGALRACHERGIRVPEDVAIVGFDDIEDGRYSVPALSTISPDKEQIARVALDLLVSRIDRSPEDPHEPRHCVARHQLIVRESSAGAAASVPLWARSAS